MTQSKKRTINGDPMKYSMRHENNMLALYRNDQKCRQLPSSPECEFWYKIEELEGQLEQAENEKTQLLAQRNIDAG